MIRVNLLTALKYLIFLTFAALISLSPSLKVIPNSLTVMSFHDNQRLVELLLVSLVLPYSMTFKSHGISFKNHKTISYTFYALITLAITSSCLAASPRHAFIEISLFAGLSYLTLLTVNLCNEDNALLVKRLIYVLWAGASLYMVSFYVGYMTSTIFNTEKSWPALLTGFSSIRSFNQYQLWGLGLMTLPLLAVDFKNDVVRHLLHVGLACWWVILFYSASRGVLLAWSFGLLVAAVAYKKLAWPLLRLQLMHAGIGYIGYQLLFQVIPSLRGTTLVSGTILRSSTSDRVELWNLCIHLIQAHPIFGIGPMHFAWVNNTVAHPHNSVLQLMAEWGLPAALIILAMAAYGLFCWLKRFNVRSLQTKPKRDSHLLIVLFFTLITNAAYSLVDGVIVMPISQIMMFTMIGLMIGYYHAGQLAEPATQNLGLAGRVLTRHVGSKPSLHSNGISWFKPIFACAVLITLIWSTLPEILQGLAGNEKYFSIGYNAIGPRFWLEVK